MERPFQTGDHISYKGAHLRTKDHRGPARDYKCQCGRQARDWAYVYRSDRERVELQGEHAGRRYSPDPKDYEPMCRACHIHLDDEFRTELDGRARMGWEIGRTYRG